MGGVLSDNQLLLCVALKIQFYKCSARQTLKLYKAMDLFILIYATIHRYILIDNFFKEPFVYLVKFVFENISFTKIDIAFQQLELEFAVLDSKI